MRPPTCFRLAGVGLSLSLGLVSLASVAWTPVKPPARPKDMRGAWARELRLNPRVEVWSAEYHRRPVPFPTTLPCEYVDTIEHGRGFVEGDRGIALTEFLARTVEGSTGRISAQTECRDSVVEKAILMVSGHGGKALVLTFSPQVGTLVVEDHHKHRAFYSMGPRTAELTNLLGQSSPDVLAISPCAVDSLPGPEDAGYAEWPPEVVTKVQPHYPPEMKSAKLDGAVVISLLINETGRVARTRIVRSAVGFDEHAIRAVEQWQFKPATSNGRPLSLWVEVPVSFQMK